MSSRPSPRWLIALALAAVALVTLAYQRSEPYTLDLAGHRDDGVLEGFHAPEGKGANVYRWTERRADVRLPALYPGQPVALVMRLAGPRPFSPNPVPVIVRVNDRPVAMLEAGAAFADYAVALDAAALGPGGDLHITLATTPYAAPNDGRELGVMVARIAAAPAASVPYLPSLTVALMIVALSLAAALWQRRLGVPERAARVADGALAVLGALAFVLARIPAAQALPRVLLTVAGAFAAAECAARLGRFAGDRRAYRLTSALFLAAFALRVWIATSPGDEANFIAFRAMLDQATRYGIAQVYGLDPVYGAYPPWHHYHLWLVGMLYQAFVSSDLYTASASLNALIKLPTIIYDMAITVLVMAYAARQGGARVAWWAGAAIALNPAIIYISAYNGQFGDPIYAFYVVLAVVGLLSRNPLALGIGTALAVLTKPQASAFAPFLALGMLWQLGRGRAAVRPIMQTLAAGAAAAALVLAPFALAGTLPDLMHTVSTTIGHGPRVSANAFNIWWLAGWGDAWNINDTRPLTGSLSYRAFSLLLFFGVAYGWIAWRTWRARSAGGLALIAGFAGLSFFMLPTEIHENYIFPTLALLPLFAAHDRRGWWLAGVLAVSGFLNNAMIDLTIVPPLNAAFPPAAAVWFPLSIVVAMVQTGALALWAWWLREA